MIEADGELTVRIRSRGGPVARTVVDRPVGWMQGAHHVILLIHGYNNDQCEACKSFQSFLHNLPGGLGRVGNFFWPGDADFGKLQSLDYLSYPDEINDARTSAKRLAQFLAQVTRANPAMEVTLVGHSLGCRLILEMLEVFATQVEIRPVPNIKLILFMAAAVPVQLVRGKLRRAGNIARQRLVLFSPKDSVLRLAFPAGQALAYTVGNETAIYLEAVGLYGSPSYFATEQPRQAYGNEHGDYWKDTNAAAYLVSKLGTVIANKLAMRQLPERKTMVPRNLSKRSLPMQTMGKKWSACERCH